MARYDPYRQWLDEEREQDQTQEQQAVQQALGAQDDPSKTPPADRQMPVLDAQLDRDRPQRAATEEPSAPGSPTTAAGRVSSTAHPWDPQINQWYQTYLKRTPSASEIQPHYRNPGGLAGIERTILSSPEYQALQQALSGYADLEGNYGGYQAPAWMPATWGETLPGWSAENWGNVDMLTPKYVVGRILSNYDVTTEEGINAAIADIQKAYPGTTWNGFDTITIPGVGAIDIIAAAGGANPSWWWGALDGMPSGQAAVDNAASINSLVGPDFNWSGMSPNDLLRMAMSRLAMNRVFWDNPMNTPW